MSQRDSGIGLIAAERQRQIESEGYNHSHDDRHTGGAIARAAAKYALPKSARSKVSYPRGWHFKPSPNDRIRELTKAGALLAAEIDRLLRKQRLDPSHERSGR